MSQHRIPDEIIVSAVIPEDVPETTDTFHNIRKVFGSIGSCCQRNRGMSYLIDTTDIIAFMDDDFIVGDDYFLNLERIFEHDRLDRWCELERSLPMERIRQDLHSRKGFDWWINSQQKRRHITIREIRGTYGCNMAFRTTSIGSVRFDERLPLYGWQEDLDFCGALRGPAGSLGRIVWGVHLGTKRGKGSEVRLGYSQMINPAYIFSKGNMSFAYAFRLAAKNFLANLIKSIHPESYVDRRGRLRGNLIGLFHLITGRLTPEYILELD